MSLSDEWPIERRVASLLSAEFHPADRNGAQLTREKASEKCQMLPAGGRYCTEDIGSRWHRSRQRTLFRNRRRFLIRFVCCWTHMFRLRCNGTGKNDPVVSSRDSILSPMVRADKRCKCVAALPVSAGYYMSRLHGQRRLPFFSLF